MEQLKVRVDTVPAEVTAQTLPTLTVRGMVTNVGLKPVDIQSYASDLLVDGAASMAWSMAIGNGSRDERERALPPGEMVVFQRVMGSALFDRPGDHVLVLRVQGIDSPPFTVRLAP
jgi:hypothetical protein